MSDSSSEESEGFEEIKAYFTAGVWGQLSTYEKRCRKNIYENYQAMLKAGFAAKLPALFVQKKDAKARNSRPKADRRRAKQLGGDDSEDEWTPACERRSRRPPTQVPPGKSKPEKLPTKHRPPTKTTKFQVPSEEKKTTTDSDKPATVSSEPQPPRYPKRAAGRRFYEQGDLLDDDDFIYCDDCEQEWEGDCPQHGALQEVADTAVAMGVPDRARQTVPKELAIAPSKIQGAGLGVWTRQRVPRRVRFGPYEGVDVPLTRESGYGWEIRRHGRPHRCVDAEDESTSNWMRYVNCARAEQERNVVAYQHKGSMYYRTVKDVPAHTELLVYYGPSYAKDLGIKDFKATPCDPRILNGCFSCGSCALSFGSPLYLESHRSSGHCSGLRRKRPESTEPAQQLVLGDGTTVVKCGDCSCAFTSRQYLERHRLSGQCPALRRAGALAGGGDALQSTKTTAAAPEQPVPQVAVALESEEPRPGPGASEQCDGATGKRHACEVCGRRFDRVRNLHRHSLTHTGERPFACEVCGKTFNVASNLHKHSLTHTGERPFACVVCGKTFNQASHLHTHSLTHTGERPYACEVCGKTFNRASHLHDHSRVHTKERPFACVVCGKTFNRASHLHRHSRRHHSAGGDTTPCDPGQILESTQTSPGQTHQVTLKRKALSTIN